MKQPTAHSTDKSAADVWRQSVLDACGWMIDVAMVHKQDHGLRDAKFVFLDRYQDWRGAFKGEYRAADNRWDFFCPIWHGGQAVKALTLAYETLSNSRLLAAARQGVEFILRHQISDRDDEDYGLVLAYESGSQGVNTSAILECLDALFELSRVTGERRYADAAIDALRWVQRKMYMPGEGLFRDEYDPVSRSIQTPSWVRNGRRDVPGRPLLDDGVFLKGYELTGEEAFKTIAVETADRLLADEDPPGTWKKYPPACAETGVIHPRHSYWWGRPMWMVYEATGRQEYLDCCRRAAEWYAHAMRTDGGLFRNTGPGFKTPSFGHATSGIECAAIMWLDLIHRFGDPQWRRPLRTALQFCRSVQFIQCSDPNLRGAILEKVLPPNNSDAPPWYLRDIGTFFYVQAVSLALQNQPQLLTAEP